MKAIDKYRALLDEMLQLFDKQSFICPHICNHCSKTKDCQREAQILTEMENLRKGQLKCCKRISKNRDRQSAGQRALKRKPPMTEQKKKQKQRKNKK